MATLARKDPKVFLFFAAEEEASDDDDDGRRSRHQKFMLGGEGRKACSLQHLRRRFDSPDGTFELQRVTNLWEKK